MDLGADGGEVDLGVKWLGKVDLVIILLFINYFDFVALHIYVILCRHE